MSAKHDIINAEDALLIVIDVQDKLLKAIDAADIVVGNCVKLAEASLVLSVPVICTLQYEEKLGPCTNALKDVLVVDAKIFDKRTFSCMYLDKFAAAVKKSGKKQIILCGVETHVCVSQTAIHLIQAGYDVFVVSDAVSSRTYENKLCGLERMNSAGCALVSTEMAIFEMTKDSALPVFKKILPIIK